MDLSNAFTLARNNNLELVSDNIRKARRRLMFRSARLYITFEMYDRGLLVTYQHE